MRRSRTRRATSIASSIAGQIPTILARRRLSDPEKARPALDAGRLSVFGKDHALALERIVDGALGVSLDLPQVALAAETLCIHLIDILGARRPRREPAAVGGDLDAAEGLAVAGGGREHRADRLAGQ